MRGLGLLAAFLLLVSPVLAVNVIQVSTDKSVYLPGENITVTGRVLSGGLPVSGASLTLGAANQSDVIFSGVDLVSNSDGLFNYTATIPAGTTAKYYTLGVTDGDTDVNSTFRVVSEREYYDLVQVVSGSVIAINTSLTDGSGFDFSEVSNNSLIRIGNATIGGDVFYFILTDPDSAGVYNKVYIDDDKNFTLTDAVESGNEGSYVESGPLSQGGSWNNSFSLIKVFTDGSGLIIGKPVNSISYSPSSTISVIAVGYNGNDSPLNDYSVNVSMSSASSVISSSAGLTDSFGLFTASFTAPSSTGNYFFNANGLAYSNFFVETFNARVKLMDLSGSDSVDFLPDEPVTLRVSVFDANGDPVIADNLVANITSPNGSVTVIPLTSFTSSSVGVYDYTINPLLKSVEGGYSVSVLIVNNSNLILKSAGFSVDSYSYKLMSVNPRTVGNARDERRVMSSSFSPFDNITFAVMKINNSKAGDFSMKLEDIASSNTDDAACRDLISLDYVRDSNGNEVSVYNLSITTLHNQLIIYGDDGEPFIQKQCALVFNYNVTGTYRVGISVNDGVKSSVIGSVFTVQNLDSIAYPVTDSSSNTKVWAQAPNKTINFKVKVKDLATDSFLPDENITNVQLLRVSREFPAFADVTQSVANISYSNATLSFTAPASEGGYSVKYLFTANTSRGVETGIGTAFMMLKKYNVYASPTNCNMFCSPSQNISLLVMALDIDSMGSSRSSASRTGNPLIVQVESMVNEDSFKVLTHGVDYTVTSGVMGANSYNATLNITPINMPAGFYSLRLLLRDSVTNDTYFGWGGFEVRNFIVTADAYDGSGSINPFSNSEPTYQSGNSSIVFAVSVYNISNGMSPDAIINPSDYSVNLTGIQSIDYWPPVSVSPDDYSYTVSLATIGSMDYYVFNVTGLTGSGSYWASFSVDMGGVVDSGNFMFSLSSFDVEPVYRTGWPAVYGSGENVSVVLNAVDIVSGAPYDLGAGASVVVSDLFDVSVGQPVFDGLVYSASCAGSSCSFELNTSSLAVGDDYFLRLTLTDSDDNSKDVSLMFRVKDLIVGVPYTSVLWNCRNDLLFSDITVDSNGSPISVTMANLIDPLGVYSDNPFGSVNSSVFVATDGLNVWVSNESATLNCASTTQCNTNCAADDYCDSAVIGGDLVDPWNRLWRVLNIANNSPINYAITFKGLNTTAGFGVSVNTSYSLSGDFIVCLENESQMGSWNQLTNDFSGVDLNSDGDVNDNIYALLIDNASAGVYNSFIWSFNQVFNGSPVSILNTSPVERSFGAGTNKITALSINQQNDYWSLRYYVNQPGDWSDLGEAGLNSEFKVPVMAYRPNGSPLSANVSLNSVSVISSGSFDEVDLSSACGYAPNTSLINGVGEINVNLGDCAYDFTAGEYAFNVRGEYGSEVSSIDPWVKPRITLRTYRFAVSTDYPHITDEPLNLSFVVTNYNGSPIVGANITVNVLTADWPQTVFNDYNASPEVAVSDDNGSALMVLTPDTEWGVDTCYLIEAVSSAVEGNETQTIWSCFW